MSSLSGLEQINAELTRRLRQQELAAELADFSVRNDDLQSVLDEACRLLSDGMECRFSKVLEYEADQHCFLVRAGVGWLPGVVGHTRLGGDLASPAGYAFQTGLPVLSNHLARETRFRTPALLVEHGVHRAFNVLIHTADERYGVLEVDSPDEGDFTVTDTAFLQSLSAILANAIAKQKRIEELRRSHAFVQSVLDASPDCMKVLDVTGRLERMNASGVCLLELDDFSTVAGTMWERLWPDEARPKVRAAIAGAAEGVTSRFEAFAPTAKGKPRWWDVLVAPINPADGSVQQVVSISRDISERVAAAEAKDLLMLEVHHRVKNSLQLVQNLLSLQARAAQDGQAAEQLNESAARVRTIAAIHDRLYQTGSALVVEVGPYLSGLVEDLQKGLASTLDGRRVEVETDAVSWPAAEIPTLGLVVTELVTNALKYGGGTIRVSFRQPPESHGTLIVEDEGEGLPDGFDVTRSRGLGMRLIQGLLRGKEAGLVIERRDGRTRFIAKMPAPRFPAA